MLRKNVTELKLVVKGLVKNKQKVIAVETVTIKTFRIWRLSYTKGKPFCWNHTWHLLFGEEKILQQLKLENNTTFQGKLAAQRLRN